VAPLLDLCVISLGLAVALAPLFRRVVVLLFPGRPRVVFAPPVLQRSGVRGPPPLWSLRRPRQSGMARLAPRIKHEVSWSPWASGWGTSHLTHGTIRTGSQLRGRRRESGRVAGWSAGESGAPGRGRASVGARPWRALRADPSARSANALRPTCQRGQRGRLV
jgi:hypothetical protein